LQIPASSFAAKAMNYPETAGVGTVDATPIRGALLTALTSEAMNIWSFP
jgi:hypothetical protein